MATSRDVELMVVTLVSVCVLVAIGTGRCIGRCWFEMMIV